MKKLLGVLTALVLVANVAAAQSPGRTTGERVDDAKITAVVKAKLVADRVGNLVSVNVDTKDGVVHLDGTVPTAEAKVEAERLARQTDGVRSVMNDLKVRTEGSASPRS
jgi:hyperosmotically inducible periplasmic protein